MLTRSATFHLSSSHLRTFYAGLYQRISLADLTDEGGETYRIAGDVAQMFAMHELAGPHGRFVAEVLYNYNRANPLNDDKLDRARQIRTENEIREKARYGRLSSLKGTNRPREVCFVTGAGRSLFGVSGPLAEADWWRRPFRQLRSVLNRLGYTVREAPTPESIRDPHKIVVFDVRPEELKQLERYSNEDISLVLWRDQISAPENFDAKVHARFNRIYTWCEDLIDNQKNFRFRLPFLRPMIRQQLPFEDRRCSAPWSCQTAHRIGLASYSARNAKSPNSSRKNRAMLSTYLVQDGPPQPTRPIGELFRRNWTACVVFDLPSAMKRLVVGGSSPPRFLTVSQLDVFRSISVPQI